MFQAPSTATARSASPSIKFRDMTVSTKLGFVLKLCIFFITFGVAFPNLLVD